MLTVIFSFIVPLTREAPLVPCRGKEIKSWTPRRIETGVKIILIGLDGATWKAMKNLVEKGSLPNMQKLIKGGVWGPLKSLYPAKSPVIWTTIATGAEPKRHGVTDFSAFSAPGISPIPQKMRWPKWTLCKKLAALGFRTGFTQRRPFSSVSRRVPAIWNVASHAGLLVGVLNWWCSWPAEQINGFMVTQRVSYSPGEAILGTEGTRPGETHPPELLEAVSRYIIPPEALTAADLEPFLKADREELDGLIENRGSGKKPVNFWFWFTHTLQSDRSFERIALKLYQQERPDLFLLYHQGIDVVEHFFWHLVEPGYFQDVPEEDTGIFEEIIPAYYRYEDEVIGQFMELSDEKTVFIIVSDHGMDPTGELPKSGDHVRTVPDGVIILSGPGIAGGKRLEASVYDVAPTILYLMGLPVAEDMPGAPLLRAFESDFISRFPVLSIPTFGCRKPEAAGPSPSDDELIRRLKDIGYLD